MRNIPSSEEVFLLGDFNLRLKEFAESHPTIAGPYTSCSTAQSTYEHFLPTLDYLATRGMRFVNTFVLPLHASSFHTWQHPKGSTHQIDFVVVGEHMLGRMTHYDVLPGAFDCVCLSDHSPVVAKFVIEGGETVRGHSRIRKPQNAAHLERFLEALPAALATVDYCGSASKRIQDLQFAAASALQQTASASRQPTKSWIAEDTWKLMEALHRFRRDVHQWEMGYSSTHGLAMALKELPKELIPEHVMFLRFASFDRNLHHADDDDFLRHPAWRPANPATQTPLQRKVKDCICHAARVVKRKLRKDKRDWHHTQVTRVQASITGRHSKEAFSLLRHLLPKDASKINAHRRALLLDDGSGTLTFDQSEIDCMWTKYWTAHLNADSANDLGFHLFEVPGIAELPAEVPQVFCVADVNAALKRANLNKSAPDVLHASLWQHIPGLANALCDQFNAIHALQRVPPAYSGSIVVPVVKRGKSTRVMASHRPVQLALAESKLFSRLTLEQLRAFVVSTFSPHQFSAGKSAGTDHAHFLLNQLSAVARERKYSCGYIYLDLVAAFDSVVRELIVSPAEPSAAHVQALTSLGCPEGDALALFAHVRRHPLALCNQGIPERLWGVINAWLARPWVQLQSAPLHHDVDPCDRARAACATTLAPRTGVKQGDNLSGMLFCVYLQTIVSELHAYICELDKNVAFRLDHPSWRSLAATEPSRDRIVGLTSEEARPWTPRMDADGTVAITHVSFADDLVLPLQARDPGILVRVCADIMLKAIRIFQRFRMKINLGAGKSEISLCLRGARAKPTWQHLKNEARTFNECAASAAESVAPMSLQLPDHSAWVRVVQHYNYLGRITSPTGDTSKEVRARIGAARTAFATHKSILCSSAFTIPTRLHLFQVLVRIHLTQNLYTTASLSPKDWCALSHAYLGFLRQLVRLSHSANGQNGQDGLLHTQGGHGGISDTELLGLLALPSIPCIARYQRLSYLQRVAIADNELLRSAFAITCETSLWSAWVQDLGHVHTHPSLRHLPVPCLNSISVWIQHIVLAGTEWKRTLRSALLPCRKFDYTAFRNALDARHRLFAVEDVYVLEPPEPEVAPEEPHEADLQDPVVCAIAKQLCCHICDQQFSSRAGLSAHKRRLHRLHPPLALRLSSTECPTCKAQLGTRTRVLKHLHECLNKWDDLHSRSQLPRSGPIPVIGGVPTSQGVTPLDFNTTEESVGPPGPSGE
eukprot:3699353-Amphidinium_carterae.1